MILKVLPAGACLLDLCCGTGQLAQALILQGYSVTGLDGSEEMIRLACENVPEATFIVADARSFTSSEPYHGVLSTFDSLNHLMSLKELTSVFRNVHTVLQEGGLFLFDLNMEEGYKTRWHGSFSIVEDDHVCVVQSRYHPKEEIGQTDITIFRLAEGWQRSDPSRVTASFSPEVSSAI